MSASIGYVRIRAQNAAARFWSAETEVVSGRIMVPAVSTSSYQTQLSDFLAGRGLELQAVEAVAPVPTTGSPELLQMAQSITEPVLFDRLTDAAKSPAATVSETSRAELAGIDGLWALLDGAAWPGLPGLLAGSGHEHLCLYTSTDPDTLAMAPWLVRLHTGGSMIEAYLNQPADAHMGILLRSRSTGAELRRTLRRYTMVRLPDRGPAPVYFRFYDPRVAIDLASALDRRTLGAVFSGCTDIYAPLSPHCVLPDFAPIALPVTPFDTLELCQTRMVRITPPGDGGRLGTDVFTISAPEYARFQAIQRRKAERQLARKLSEKYLGHSFKTYRETARAAPTAGKRFNMNSTKQVSILARAMILHGPAFWEKNPEATHILTRSDIQPWQKKDALIRWMIETKPPEKAAS